MKLLCIGAHGAEKPAALIGENYQRRTGEPAGTVHPAVPRLATQRQTVEALR